MAKRQPLGVTVKETVDFMYEMLIQHPNGCEFSASSLGATPARVVCILVQRGIVERKNIYTKNGQKSMYKWAVNQAPTYVLYGSITQELRDKMKNEAQRCEMKKGRKEEVTVDPAPVVTRPVSDEVDIIHEGPTTPTPEFAPGLNLPEKRNPLEIYGIDELWTEIKRRGCFIEDNHLVLVKKVVFD